MTTVEASKLTDSKHLSEGDVVFSKEYGFGVVGRWFGTRVILNRLHADNGADASHVGCRHEITDNFGPLREEDFLLLRNEYACRVIELNDVMRILLKNMTDTLINRARSIQKGDA